MRRAFPTDVVVVCVAAAVALVVAGCTAAAAVPGADGRSGADAVETGRAITDAEQLAVDEARELLIKDCMAAQGFRYWPVPVGTVEERQGSGYVLDDVGWAREHGYGTQLQDRVAALQQNDPNHAYANALPEPERLRYSDVLDGNPSAGLLTAELPAGGTIQTPSDSCVAKAKGELYGEFPAWFQAEKVATNLVGLYADDLVADERFRVALAAWSACMHERGHDYPDPPAIRQDLARLTEGLSDGRARAVEKRLAVDEATCAVRETSLVSTTRDLEREYRDGLRQYRDDVAEYHRLQHVALEKARAVLAR